jgi:hypothetical protein
MLGRIFGFIGGLMGRLMRGGLLLRGRRGLGIPFNWGVAGDGGIGAALGVCIWYLSSSYEHISSIVYLYSLNLTRSN